MKFTQGYKFLIGITVVNACDLQMSFGFIMPIIFNFNTRTHTHTYKDNIVSCSEQIIVVIVATKNLINMAQEEIPISKNIATTYLVTYKR